MNQIDINDSHYAEDELHEECGVFGVYDFDGNDVSSTIYYGLFALQHRGQESCGIAVSDTEGPKGKVLSYKDMGLVNEVFNPEKLEKLNGNIGVGHVRYSTAGSSSRENAQPLVLNYVKGTLGMAHNGNLLNAVELREELSYTGAIFQTTIDSEVIAYLIARERLNVPTVEGAVLNAMKKIKGAYSLIVMIFPSADPLPLDEKRNGTKLARGSRQRRLPRLVKCRRFPTVCSSKYTQLTPLTLSRPLTIPKLTLTISLCSPGSAKILR